MRIILLMLILLAPLVSAERFVITEGEELVTNILGEDRLVKLVDVSKSKSGGKYSCIFTVDGQMGVIEKSQNENVNGVKIFVLDARRVYSQTQRKDHCEVIIGGKITWLGVEGADVNLSVGEGVSDVEEAVEQQAAVEEPGAAKENKSLVEKEVVEEPEAEPSAAIEKESLSEEPVEAEPVVIDEPKGFFASLWGSIVSVFS